MTIGLGDLGPLTEREGEALLFSGQHGGMTHDEIAGEMDAAVKTVDGWFQRIHEKLCTHSASETIFVAFDIGILRVLCFLLLVLAVGPPDSQPDMRRFRLQSSVRVVRGGREA